MQNKDLAHRPGYDIQDDALASCRLRKFEDHYQFYINRSSIAHLSQTQLNIITISILTIATCSLIIMISSDVFTVDEDDIFHRIQLTPIVFGISCGAIIGQLMRRTFLTYNKRTFNAQDKLSLGLLTLLFCLGIGGEGFIRDIGKRLSSAKISAGGIEFTLADKVATRLRVDDDAQTALSASMITSRTVGLPPSTSQGLSLVADLDRMIERDSRIEAVILSSDNNKPVEFSDNVVVPATATALARFGRCLQASLNRINDRPLVERYLLAVIDDMRLFMSSSFQEKEFYQKMIEHSSSLFELQWNSIIKPYVKEGNLEDRVFSDLINSCMEILPQICSDEQRSDIKIKNIAWMRNNVKTIDNCITYQKMHKEIIVPATASEKNFDKLYLTIAYANILAYLGETDAATFALSDWLETVATESAQTSLERWRIIRARIMLAVYLEESIRHAGSSAAPSIRTEHLRNLEELLDDLGALRMIDEARTATGKVERSLEAESFKSAPQDNEPCKIPLNAGRDVKAGVFLSYIMNRMLFIANALEHPEFKDVWSSKVDTHMKGLLDLSLKCAYGSSPMQQRAQVRSEMLDLFAIWQLKTLSDSSGDEPDERRRIKRSLAAVRLGLQIIKPYREKDSARATTEKRLIDRIVATKPMEIKESLERTRGALRRALRELTE